MVTTISLSYPTSVRNTFMQTKFLKTSVQMDQTLDFVNFCNSYLCLGTVEIHHRVLSGRNKCNVPALFLLVSMLVQAELKLTEEHIQP